VFAGGPSVRSRGTVRREQYLNACLNSPYAQNAGCASGCGVIDNMGG
jgi:hypothetical protein